MKQYVLIDDSLETTAPFFEMRITAGFPSPAQDYTETRIDLNDVLRHHPGFTFYCKVEGDSMFPEINEGDWIVVDRSAEIVNGCIVFAAIDNEFCVKRYYKRPDGGVELVSTNKKYEPINLADECVFEIFGKVKARVTHLE